MDTAGVVVGEVEVVEKVEKENKPKGRARVINKPLTPEELGSIRQIIDCFNYQQFRIVNMFLESGNKPMTRSKENPMDFGHVEQINGILKNNRILKEKGIHVGLRTLYGGGRRRASSTNTWDAEICFRPLSQD